jgi:hypothetical protein
MRGAREYFAGEKLVLDFIAPKFIIECNRISLELT